MCHPLEFLPSFLKQTEVMEEAMDDLAHFSQEYIDLIHSQAFYLSPYRQSQNY